MSSDLALPAGTDLQAPANVGSSESSSDVTAESRPFRIHLLFTTALLLGVLWEGAWGGQPGISLLPPAGGKGSDGA